MSQQALTHKQNGVDDLPGQTNTAIAEALGAARKTIIRWHKLPHIIEAIVKRVVVKLKLLPKSKENNINRLLRLLRWQLRITRN